jgi:putative transposase
MRPRHPQHLSGFDYLGPNRYSLRFCTDHRRDVFTNARVVQLVNAQFLRASGEHLFAILAHCFMPDHVHLLVEGVRADSDLRRFQAAAKQYSGFYYKKQYGQILWQRYGYERVLRSQEQTLDVVATFSQIRSALDWQRTWTSTSSPGQVSFRWTN